MEYVKSFSDIRYGLDKSNTNTQFPLLCVYCGKLATNGKGDHVPAKCFLHKPYPAGEETLVTVPSCVQCNNKTSLDEEYTAFAFKYTKYGDSNEVHSFPHYEILKKRLLSNVQCGFEQDVIVLESDRIERVLSKYAYALGRYECSVDIDNTPDYFDFGHIRDMTLEQTKSFNSIKTLGNILPEIGTRVSQMLLIDIYNDNAQVIVNWKTVQDKVFRYIAFINDESVDVKMVFEEMYYTEAIFAQL